MKIDYEKLGRIIEKIEDESPCRSMQWKELTEAARQVIAASGLLEEVERLNSELESHAWEISPAMAQAKIDELNKEVDRLQAKVSRVEGVGKHYSKQHPGAECSCFDVFLRIENALKDHK